ncbi:hypothetical protein HN450_03045 [bacterium]|nr:hypothetical protein [bacterium]
MSTGYETTNYICGCSDKGKKVDGQFVGYIERKWCDGSIYKGEFNDHYSQRYSHEIMGANGFGKFTFPNGDWHEGIYKDNVANGKGVFFYAHKNLYWRGEWQHNMPRGDGLFFRKHLITGDVRVLHNGQGIIRLVSDLRPTSSKECKRIKQLETEWNVWEYWILECEE